MALLNQDMNTNCKSYPQVSLVLGLEHYLKDNWYQIRLIKPSYELGILKPTMIG